MKLSLVLISNKDEMYYFKVNNHHELTSKYNTNDDRYYPFFNGSNDEYILKVKSKYIDSDNDLEKGQILEAEVKLKEFVLKDKANPITTHSRYPSPVKGFRSPLFKGYYVSFFKMKTI